MSDPGSTYRSRDEINAMRQDRDPIERVKKLLLTNGERGAVYLYFGLFCFVLVGTVPHHMQPS